MALSSVQIAMISYVLWSIGLLFMIGALFMSLTRELRRRRLALLPAAPAWAAPLDAEAWVFFSKKVCEHYQRRRIAFTLKDGSAFAAEDGKFLRVDLVPLISICAGVPRSRWATMIDSYCRNMPGTPSPRSDKEGGKAGARPSTKIVLGGPQLQTESLFRVSGSDSNAGPADEAGVPYNKPWAQVAKLLALRIYRVERFEGDDLASMVYRHDLPGTITVLVFDMPRNYAYVRPSVAASWGVPRETMFGVALANVTRSCRPAVQRQVVHGLTLHLINDDSALCASLVLALDQQRGVLGRHGCLVAIPQPRVMVAYGINDAAVLRAVALMVGIVEALAAADPSTAISRMVYWYDGLRFVPLPCHTDGDSGQRVLEPPEDFAELLAKLEET